MEITAKTATCSTRKALAAALLLLITAIPLTGKTPKSAAAKADRTAVADEIIVVKSTRTMSLLAHGQVLKTYRVALGEVPVGAKVKHGDHKTPEGEYTISAKNAYSQFHLALRISYPNAADRERARKLGVSPGGDVMIHGLPPKYAWIGAHHRDTDWTDGCVAVTDDEIEEIWKLVPVGTKVEIKP